MFKANMVFGVGYGMFSDYISGSRSAHNAFVLCYTELGLVGYWFWYLLIHLGMISAWRTRIALSKIPGDEARWLYRFSGLALAAMCGFLVSAYFLTRAFVFPLFFLCAMLGVLPLLVRRLEATVPGQAPSPLLVNWRRDVLLVGTPAVLVSILYIYVSIILLNKAFHG